MTVAMGKHSEWRKIAKKIRRKRTRQTKARIRDELLDKENREKENSLEYQLWLEEQRKVEAFKKNEEERIQEEENEKWLRIELLAQQQWRLLQEKIKKAKLEKAEQDLRIKKEWEEEQRKIKESEDRKKRLEAERLEQHQELMRKIEQFVSGNGELPSELLVNRMTNPDKEMCPFFSKTGACRFHDSCSRNHKYPGISKVILVSNFYTNFGIEHSRQNEHGDDITLEFDEKDVYNHFEEFFSDVYPEFEKIGKITQFKVCSNFEKHLRGNTYIEYSSLSESVNAYRMFHGRWYGGRQMSMQFCEIPSWKKAICGLSESKKCPKGRSCNFLHVFRNPGNLFRELDDMRSSRSERNHRTHSQHRNRSETWRWSESPVRESSAGRSKKDRRKVSQQRHYSRDKSNGSTRSEIYHPNRSSHVHENERHRHSKERSTARHKYKENRRNSSKPDHESYKYYEKDNLPHKKKI